MLLHLLAIRALLSTPPTARIVPEHVFDDYGWCASDELEWRRPSSRPWVPDAPRELTIDPSDAARMVFVLRAPCDFLPTELGRLHAFGLGLEEELALAPWGIDAATDGLHERRVRPGDLLWLAADNLNALVWGLHDWCHFHNHGPFVERCWTELQCDATALYWLWTNRPVVGIAEASWEAVRREIVALCARRFAEEGKNFDADWLSRDRVLALGVPAAQAPASNRSRRS